MTRKKVFSPGELATLQGQHGVRPSAYRAVAGNVHARDEDDDDEEERDEKRDEEDEDPVGTDRAIRGLSLSQSEQLLPSDTFSDTTTSPALDNVTSPSVANWSFAEALSPASVVTPSVSSIAYSAGDTIRQPSRKRARTSSNPDDMLMSEEGGERKVDLAGLLNPVDGDGRDVHSPGLRIADLDNPQPPRFEAKRVNYATESTSLTYRLGTGPQYVEIQPRPDGQKFQTEMADQARSQDGDDARRKGRRGPLESDQRRQEVLEVRGMGACLRCHIMRIRCTAVKDEACANCRETLPKSRKWCIPCTREWPRTRWRYLIPTMLRQFYDPEKCVPDYPAAWLGPSFTLPQTHWSTFSISIEARAVDLPPDRKDELAVTVFVDEGEGANHKRVRKDKRGWNFVPRMRAGLTTYHHTVQNLLLALDAQQEMIQRRWVADFITPDTGQDWVRQVLQLTIYFQREVMTTKALKAASRTLFIRHLMNTQFYIPDERLSEMNNELFPHDRRSWKQLEELKAMDEAAVARPVNELLKKALAKVLEKCLPNHFQELEALFRLQENGVDQAKLSLSSLDRDEVFCVLILTFVLIATVQTWLLHHAIWRDTDLPVAEKHFKEDAKVEIQKMEDNVVDFFLHLYKYRFYKAEMKGQPSADRLEDARKAASFNIFGEFEKVRARYEDEIYDVKHELILSDDHEQHLLAKNHTRLLLRLSDAIWRPKSHR